jgi:predicted AlkP superfamily pyrophosphatase or phosphodiesterase
MNRTPSALSLPMFALLALTAFTALPACAQRRPVPTPPPAMAPEIPAAERPKLVLFLTVDQLRPDYLQRWDAQFTGGFRRLLDEAVFYTKAVHDHGITETAPGHASTLSGRFPYSTGIASNSAGVNTPEAPLVASEGVGASPFRFKGTTLADWMVGADPRTRVLSVARKDRGAILPIGRGKHPVYWYAQRSGRFVTSTYYADSLPSWVQSFNAEDRVGTTYAGRTWNLLLPESEYPEPDSVEFESNGQGFTFPHQMPKDPEMARNVIIGQPWMDELTLEFAWRGVREMNLGGGPQTDLLAVSLSTMDAVGHRWGPDSRELHDFALRLDRMLGHFLDSLITLRGRENIVIALTSDHGVAPIPEVRSTWGDNSKARRMGRNFLDPVFASLGPLVQRAEIPTDAFTFDWPAFEVDRSKTFGKEAQLRQIARAFKRETEKILGVMRVDVIDDIARADTVKDDIARRWLHMFRPGGSTLAVVTLDPYNYVGSSVATHGTPHDYDARVPVMFWGRHFAAMHDDGTARVVDIAPTLAHLLGLTPAERLDGVVLGRAFRPARE